MALLEFNTNPSDRHLRQFGAICVFALPLVTWLWTRNPTTTGWAGLAGLLLCSVGMILPKILKPVFVGLTIVTLPIGLVVGEFAMLLIYFGLFLPMAIVFRMMKRDSLQRTARAEESTFWQKRIPPSGIRKYYQQS